MNQNILQGKWKEIKGEIRKAWGNLTDDELEKTRGDVGAISGLIQQRYGHAEQNYSEKLHGIINHFESKKDESVDAFKNKLRDDQH